ncbi:MAG: hypothetical protein ABIP03_09415 [Aquihabitans sp.]
MNQQARPGPSRGALIGLAAMVVAAIAIVAVTVGGSDDDPAKVATGSSTTVTSTTRSGPNVIEASGGTRILPADVGAIAAEMTEGLTSGDFERYSASFAMSAEDEAAQRLIFDNLRKVPMTRQDMVALKFERRAYNSSGGEVATVAAVGLIHQIDGADPRAIGQRYGLSLVKKGPEAPVQVVKIGEPDIRGASMYPQPWDLGPLHVITTERSVILGAKEDAALLDAAAPLINAGAARALDGLARQGVDIPRRVVVAVPGADESIDSLYSIQDNLIVSEASGVALDQITAPMFDIEDKEIAGHDTDNFHGAGRIVISRGTVEGRGARLTEVAAHETAHLVQFLWRPTLSESQTAFEAGEYTVDDIPRWMTEGFGDYVGNNFLPGATASDEYRLAIAAARSGGVELHKGDVESFYRGGLTAVNTRYGLGMTAFMYIEDTKGRDGALNWAFAAFHAPSAEALVRIYRDHLGTTPAEFEAAWSSWLRARA